MSVTIQSLFRSRRRHTLHLFVGQAALRARTIVGTSVLWAGETSYIHPTDVPDAIARLATECPQVCRRLVVTIDRPPVQLRTIPDLPPVKPRHLRALVTEQAGRFFRGNGQQLVADAIWIPGTTRLARAAAVEEPLVEAIATGARAAALKLDTITPTDDPAKLTLLPRSEVEIREYQTRRRTRALALSAAATWSTCAALFFARLAGERHNLERELALLQKPLAAVLDARRALRDAETALDTISVAEHQRGRALAVLTEVTGALPDSSVLTSLAWSRDGSGVLTGSARGATDIVRRLEPLRSLLDVRLSGGVVREPLAGRDWERFTIVFGADKREGEGS